MPRPILKNTVAAGEFYKNNPTIKFTQVCLIFKISQSTLTRELHRKGIPLRSKDTTTTTNSQTPESKKSPSKPTPVADKKSPKKTPQNKKSSHKKSSHKKSSHKKSSHKKSTPKKSSPSKNKPIYLDSKFEVDDRSLKLHNEAQEKIKKLKNRI